MTPVGVSPERDVVPCDLGPLQRIPVGEGRTFRVHDTEVAVFRTRAGHVFATQARCPHRGGSLADGLVGDGKVICPLHAIAFDLATGRAAGDRCASLATHGASVDHRQHVTVWVPTPADTTLGATEP